MRKGEDILPLIQSSIQNKKAVRSGMESFDDFANPEEHGKNRKMVSIGG